jgi:hypothetical protein
MWALARDRGSAAGQNPDQPHDQDFRHARGSEPWHARLAITPTAFEPIHRGDADGAASGGGGIEAGSWITIVEPVRASRTTSIDVAGGGHGGCVPNWTIGPEQLGNVPRKTTAQTGVEVETASDPGSTSPKVDRWADSKVIRAASDPLGTASATASASEMIAEVLVAEAIGHALGLDGTELDEPPHDAASSTMTIKALRGTIGFFPSPVAVRPPSLRLAAEPIVLADQRLGPRNPAGRT